MTERQQLGYDNLTMAGFRKSIQSGGRISRKNYNYVRIWR